MVVRGGGGGARARATPSTWNFGSTGPRWREIADFEPILVRSVSAVTPSEKSSIITNRKFTTRFPMSPKWSTHVAPKPQRGAQKCKTAIFRVKSHFAWRKSAIKFLCVKTISDKVVSHSLLNYPCKNDWWGISSLCENLVDADPPVCKSQVFDLLLTKH